MEGYTNITSSPEDFDDLNIERRQSRNESKIVEDRVKNSKHEEIFYEQLKVKLDDGSYGYVFTKSFNAKNVPRWHCHICDTSIFTFDLDLHFGSKKHQDRYKFSMHPASLFPRVTKGADTLEDDMPKLAPGEPVPPGFEEKLLAPSQIQATLDSYKDSPLIGLEYLVEIVGDSFPECKYVCLLCDKKGDPRVILKHLASYHHYSKYLGLYFPTVSKIMAFEFPRTKIGRKSMANVLTSICGVIEQKFGRLKPISVDIFEFQNKRGMFYNKILSDTHIRETPDSTFIDAINKIISEEREREKKSSDDMNLQSDELSEEASQCASSTFIKGRITCDRSRLRTRDSESNGFKDTDGQVEERILPFRLKNAVSGKVLEDKEGSCVSGINTDLTKIDGSASPISTLSFSSDILSRSPSRSRSKSRSQTRSIFYQGRSVSPSKPLYSRLPRPRIDNRVYQPGRYNQRIIRSRSKSKPRSRSGRSRSITRSRRSSSRSRRSNSKSNLRSRRSNSKTNLRLRRSNSKTNLRSRRSNSKTNLRSRRSNSKSNLRSRRSNSKSNLRSRRSNSKSNLRSRRSNSKSNLRSRRSNSKSNLRSRRSNSKSNLRSRRSNSKSNLRSRRSNSKSNSRSRRSNSKSKSQPNRTDSKSNSQSIKSNSKSNSQPIRSNSKSKSLPNKTDSKLKSQSRKSRSRSRSRRSRSRSRSKRSSSRSRLSSRQSNLRHKPRSQSKSPPRAHKRNEHSSSPSNNKRSPQTADLDMCREKNKWDLFRREVGRMEDEAEKLLKFHEKNPEKHPSYPEEWKKFWNRRYKELQSDGKDPDNHDFKPEWIEFWNKRMHTIHEEELRVKKDEIRKKFKLPDDVPASGPLFLTGNKRKNRPDDDLSALSTDPSLLEATDKRNESERNKDGIRSKRSLSPWEESKPGDRTFRSSSPLHKRRNDQNLRGAFSSRGRGNPVKSFRLKQSNDPELLSVLRLLTAMENQLGSLGPKVNNLMAKAIALEKKASNSSDVLLNDSENVVLFETVKEKLRGQLIAGIVGRNMVAATRACLEHLGVLLKKVDQRIASNEVPLAVSTPLTDLPVVVPGIGTMDKVAIAQQIASALVAQGKTDVTQEELEQLINAVVGMAHNSTVQPVSAAQLITNMKETPSNNTNLEPLGVEKQTPLQQLLSMVNSTQSLSATLVGNKNDSVSGLALLQSAYEEARISPASRNFMKDMSSEIVSGNSAVKYTQRSEQDMSYLSEDELKTLLQNFKDLSTSEQQHLITYLKKIEETEPARVEKLRKFVNIGSPVPSFSIPGKELTTKNSNSKTISRRLSPFSLRLGGSNPSVEEKVPASEAKEKKISESDPDSDEDYSFEDIYAAASKKVKEREKAKEEEEKLKAAKEEQKTEMNATAFTSKKSDDPAVILKETKAMIANLMGQLPGKFIQKQQTNVSSPKKESILTNANSFGNQLNSPIVKDTGQNCVSVPNILSLATVPPPIADGSAVVGQQYPPQDPVTYQDSYSNQYSEQVYVPQDANCSQYAASYGNTYDSSYYNQYQPTYPNQGISSQNMYPDHVTNVYPGQSHQTMYGQQDVYQVSSQSEPYRHQQQSYENQDPYQYASQRQTYY